MTDETQLKTMIFLRKNVSQQLISDSHMTQTRKLISEKRIDSSEI
jgi:hypothetical protein